MDPRRRKTLRIVLAIALCIFVCTAATVGLGAVAVYRAGTIAVDVQPEDGRGLALHLPAGLVELAAFCIPRSALDEVAREFEPWLPVAMAAYEQLAAAPDFVLVEALDGRDHVRVEKIGSKLRVQVESDEQRVDVTIPLRTVKRLLGMLET